MDFTREPVIETIITPREGFRLVVRSSKSVGQEEHFVDSVEVVSFGKAAFFRSTERPKPFLVPVSDYEVLEVREQRLILKAKTPESVKIAGGRETGQKREREPRPAQAEPREEFAPPEAKGMAGEGSFDSRSQRRRDRRNRFRRRPREEFEGQAQEEARSTQEAPAGQMAPNVQEGPPPREEMARPAPSEQEEAPQPVFRTVLPPPSTLIRDDLQRLRENVEYRGAFYLREEEGAGADDEALPGGPFPEVLPEPPAKEVPPQEEPFLNTQPGQAETQPDVGQTPQ